MQFMFLAGALPEQPIDYEVAALQDGKRFSSRHVSGSQSGGRIVCDASVSFATAIDSPEHMAPPASDCGLDRDPESLPRLADIAAPEAREIERTLAYLFRSHVAIDFRAPFVDDLLRPDHRPAPDAVLDQDAAADCRTIRRCTRPLSPISRTTGSISPPASPRSRPIAEAGAELYVASLNHAIWLHRPLRADEWLLFDCVSPSGAIGRGLSIGRI